MLLPFDLQVLPPEPSAPEMTSLPSNWSLKPKGGGAGGPAWTVVAPELDLDREMDEEKEVPGQVLSAPTSYNPRAMEEAIR